MYTKTAQNCHKNEISHLYAYINQSNWIKSKSNPTLNERSPSPERSEGGGAENKRTACEKSEKKSNQIKSKNETKWTTLNQAPSGWCWGRRATAILHNAIMCCNEVEAHNLSEALCKHSLPKIFFWRKRSGFLGGGWAPCSLPLVAMCNDGAQTNNQKMWQKKIFGCCPTAPKARPLGAWFYPLPTVQLKYFRSIQT